jgi:hypothetical protein
MTITNYVDLTRRRVVPAITATSSVTAVPDAATVPFLSRGFGRVRTLIAYSGTVNSCTIKIWFSDPEEVVWYAGATTDELDALSPGGASPVNEARDWDVGLGGFMWWQVSAVAGGGTVSVRVQGMPE